MNDRCQKTKPPNLGTRRQRNCFYNVLLHELTHWTCKEERCNRISDLLSIQKKHINIEKRELVIVEQKTSKKRTVRLNDTAMKIIIRRLSEYPDNMYLFQSRKPNRDGKIQPLDRSTVARKFQEIGDIVGIRLGTHSMRKTRGYMMHKSGVSIEQIARVLNHSSPAVTMAYIGLTQEETLKTYDEFEL